MDVACFTVWYKSYNQKYCRISFKECRGKNEITGKVYTHQLVSVKYRDVDICAHLSTLRKGNVCAFT